MKPIIRVLLFMLTLVFLSKCEKGPTSIKIKDNNFLNALIEQGVDTDGNGKISKSEAEVITYLDDDVIEGSSYLLYSTFIHNDISPGLISPQNNPYGQVLCFLGTDPNNQFELGAEIEFSMGEESEKHTFNQSTAVYIPPGLVYSLTNYRVDRPFILVNAVPKRCL